MTITIDPWQIACSIGSIAFLLLVMWIERQTSEERAAEERKRKKWCKKYHIDEVYRYTVFYEDKLVYTTNCYLSALKTFEDSCVYANTYAQDKNVRLFDSGTLIKERKEL